MREQKAQSFIPILTPQFFIWTLEINTQLNFADFCFLALFFLCTEENNFHVDSAIIYYNLSVHQSMCVCVCVFN